MSGKFQAPKGVSEYFPPRSNHFDFVLQTLTIPALAAGYELIELPIFEDTDLFTRGVGESTDVVTKEMYTFEDRGGRSITLRPEGTAGVMRAVIEHNLDKGQLPVKLFYTGPFFRAERPQAGRYRQFYQVGIEAIGFNDPEILVPAMHPEMWSNQATVANVELLRNRGFIIIDPEEGRMTGNDFGVGRYPDINKITSQITKSMNLQYRDWETN